jgi:ribosomal protein RSM22 (predicted rRNA methylase)
MEWRCRQEIEDALWHAARKQLRPADLARKPLLRAITERTALYTTERDELAAVARTAMPGIDLAARALFFSVADAAKISIPLSELAARNCLPTSASWKVLDLGAGAGAMGLGLLSFLADSHPGLAVHFDAVDLDAGALSIYSGAVHALAESELDLGALSIRTIESSAANYQAHSGHYDLVVLGSMLNELSERERIALGARAMEAVAPGGALIIVEPALRETSRALHRVRDSLVAAGTNIFAPCTHSQAHCPALLDERDWCHEDRAVVLPSRARQMAQTTGLRDGGLKFSYLVARHTDEPLVVVEDGEIALRVVGQPQRGKGQRECFVCGPDLGRRKLRLLKRNRSSKNRVLERAHRGDVLVAKDTVMPPEDERLEIGKEQRVTLIRPAELLD